MSAEGYFKSADHLDFYERRWEPEMHSKANLVLLHGYGEHCSRYDHVGKALSEAGIAVYTYDQRGYGRSPGKRAYIDNFDALLADLDVYLEHVQPRLKDLPFFMMGHSMGGMVLAAYMQTRQAPVRGLIFSSPFLALNDDVPKILLALANVLGAITPWLPVARVDNSGLSRDPKVVEAADNDPLSYHGMVKARTGAQFNAVLGRIQPNFEAISAPIYVIHGEEDRIVPNAGSRMLYERCSSADKTLKIYAGGYHELWNDLEKEAVISGIRDWILARV